MNQKRDAINIAPFVDILLVLFVILIVTSNFADVAEVTDVNVTEQKIKIKELTNLLSKKELLIQELTGKTKELEKVSLNKDKFLSNKIKELEKALKSKETKYSQLSDKLSTLKQENKSLLSKLQSKRDSSNQDYYYKTKISRLNETIRRLEKENQKLREEKKRALSAGLPIFIGNDGNFYLGKQSLKNKISKYSLYRFIEKYKPPFTAYYNTSSRHSAKSYQEFKIWYETKIGGKLQ